MMTSNDGHKLDQNSSFSEHLTSAFVSEQTLADISRNLTRFSETNQTACGLKNSDLWLFHSICKHARNKNVKHNSAHFSKLSLVVVKNVFLISYKVTTNWGIYQLDFIIVFQTASFEVSCCHNRNDSTFLFFKMLMWWCHTFCVLLEKYYYLGFCRICIG